MNIYLTGPSFTPYVCQTLLDLQVLLTEAGHSVRCVTFTDDQLAIENETSAMAAAVFRERLEAMEPCDAMVALLDGSQADDGTSLEIGVYHALMLSDERKRGILGLMLDRRGIQRLPFGGGINYLTLGVILEKGRVCAGTDELLAALREMA